MSGPGGGGARSPIRSTPGQRPGTARIVAGLLLLALAGGTLGAVLFVRAMNRTRLDAGLVAVAPLALGAPDLDSAGSAIAATLVERLRGGGGRAVRPVAPATALRAWDSHAAPAEAAVLLAQRTGAALVVLAQLWPQRGGGGGKEGADSVRLVARLLDVGRNAVLARYEIRAPRGQASALGDSLARLLLREFGRDSARAGDR